MNAIPLLSGRISLVAVVALTGGMLAAAWHGLAPPRLETHTEPADDSPGPDPAFDPLAPWQLSAAPAPDEFATLVQPFLQNWCLDCHSGESAEAGIDLDRFDSLHTVLADTETWKAVVDALESDYMPPGEAEQPPDEDVAAIRRWFATEVAGNDAVGGPPGIMRRMNRTEYQHTVRDLLRMKPGVFDDTNAFILVDDYFQPASGRMPRYVLAMSRHQYLQRKPGELTNVSELPVDPPVEHGFSNDHTTLSFSPFYLEMCLSLAHDLVNDPGFPGVTEMWEALFVDPEGRTGTAAVELARARLEIFLTRAFRRPVTSEELDRYCSLFAGELGNGDFTSAMKATVAAVLSSPSFLFRRDFAAGNGETRPDPYMMASRLSYFLWSSMPDDELFQAAAEGRLQTDEQLEYQVRRMMADRKIRSLSTDFASQWLKINKVNSARPDQDLYPKWYRRDGDTPGVSMMIEQTLLFETIMIEDRSILEFIHADFAYLNRQLMDWYFLNPAEVLGYTPPEDSLEDFFRIRWPNRHRGGILTSGAMLASTSATNRSSPVYRGAWILDVVFNRPPPPPPPEVPALDTPAPGQVTTHVREKLERHRQDATCAVCHNRIDPVGFALEKYDTVGRFRQAYEDGQPIDATGELNGESYDGAARFKAVVLRQRERFVRGFAEHLMKYALGRKLHVSDQPEVERIVAKLAQADYRFSAVVREIVLSGPFRAAIPQESK